MVEPTGGAGPDLTRGPGRHRRTSALIALWSVLAGLALFGATVLVACGSRGTPSVGGDTVASLAAPTPTVSGPAVPIQSGGLPAAPAVVVPARLSIPKIAVNATVRPAGIDPKTGDFAVPPSVDVVGWYQFGPGLEARAGSVVIAGHVDSAVQGQGAFFRLRELAPGDAITVTGADGTGHAFRVVAREEWTKSKIPLDRYFARDGELRLTLITCGGPFDAATRNYRDNIVITAAPA